MKQITQNVKVEEDEDEYEYDDGISREALGNHIFKAMGSEGLILYRSA